MKTLSVGAAILLIVITIIMLWRHEPNTKFKELTLENTNLKQEIIQTNLKSLSMALALDDYDTAKEAVEVIAEFDTDSQFSTIILRHIEKKQNSSTTDR